jgi:hypothetical protein
MPSAIILTLYVLAVARVSRLITSDKLTEKWRYRFVASRFRRAYGPDPGAEQMAQPPLLAYLAMCPWCISIWVGAVAAPVVALWGRSPWVWAPAFALAASYVTGFLAQREGQ